jgi:hypothetical protein
MNCKSIRLYYLDHLENSLSLNDRRAFDEHLRQCPVCHGDFQAYTATCALLRAVPAQTAPHGFSAKVRESLLEGPADAPAALFQRGFFSPSFAWAAAASMALLAVSLFLFREQPSPASGLADGNPAPPAATLPAEEPSVLSPATPAAVPVIRQASAVKPQDIHRELREIGTLVQDINQLADSVYEQPVYLGGDEQHELVFDPYQIYNRQTAPVDAEAASYSQ